MEAQDNYLEFTVKVKKMDGGFLIDGQRVGFPDSDKLSALASTVTRVPNAVKEITKKLMA